LKNVSRQDAKNAKAAKKIEFVQSLIPFAILVSLASWREIAFILSGIAAMLSTDSRTGVTRID
jgi:hypothetical protein